MLEAKCEFVVKDSLIENCSLSIMEAAIVWELLLLNRKFLVISQKALSGSHREKVKEICANRTQQLELQILGLEDILKKSGLPVPSTYPVDAKKIVFLDDTAIVKGLLAQFREQAIALGYLIRSSLSSDALRLLAAYFLAEEMKLLESTCREIKAMT